MKYLSKLVTSALTCVYLCGSAIAGEKPMGLTLPTDNRFLFSNTPEKYYMYTYRSFGGKSSRPYTAGKYGYVRNLKNTAEGVIATKFHEGIDISPAKRDSAGRPLDLIKSIAAGTVVHVNADSRASNYGRYMVVEHDWGSGKFFSLYAHLDKISAVVGQRVNAGSVIAKMGYTGVGINRERAHLHLELNVMTHRSFNDWHAHYFGGNSKHGPYNGLNMNGLDVSEALIKSNANKRTTVTQIIKSIPVYFKVVVPRTGDLDIATRYPWIRVGNHRSASASWEISFASTGFPLAVAPSGQKVTKPVVSYVKPTKTNQSYRTKGLITGSGSSAKLTSIGARTIALISGSFPRKPKVITPKIAPEDIPKELLK